MELFRDELIASSRKSISNAKALMEEAKLFFQNKHWARTVFLCHTAGGEFAKSIECMSATIDLACPVRCCGEMSGQTPPLAKNPLGV
jgi:hypothetical protein